MDTEHFTHWSWRLVVATALTMAGTAALGQENSGQTPQETQPEQELAEVTVTGSRIARRDYESQSPIVTVQAEAFEDRSSVGIESTLNQLPQFQPAGTGQNTAGGDAATPFPSPTAAPGAATVNLRGLGTNRSLVLVDGRRVQPVNGNLVVDLNTIPAAAIQSVEVITGGAAAVYGADAISGVVNLILKQDFEGAQLEGQYGITQRGDGQESQFSALFGGSLNESRGHVMFGASYARRETIASSNRAWIRKGWSDPGTAGGGAGTAGGLSQFECQAPGFFSTGNCPAPGTFDLALGATQYGIDQNGNVFDVNDPLNPAHPYTGPLGGDSGFRINPNGSLGYNDQQSGTLSLPLQRWSIFGSTNYDLNDSIEMFADSRFSQSFVSATGGHVSLWNIWSIQMPYSQQYDDPDSPDFGLGPVGTAHHPVPAALADLLNARVSLDPTFDPLTAPWQYNGNVDYLPAYRTDTTSNVFQITGGLRGRLPIRDWSWEVYGTHGKSSVNARLPESFLSWPKVQQLMEQDQYGTGWINPAIIAAAGRCTSGLPIFNADGSVNNTDSVSRDCADYMTLRMNNVSTVKQDVMEATMQGTLADLWAGPLQVAAGLSYRRDDFNFTPDAAYNANQDDANVVNNIALPLAVDGLTKVKEFFVEAAIPVVSGLPFVKKLELDPGIRFSDYQPGSKVDTWKALADWQVSDYVRFRGGFQHANRAPNITELFMPTGAASIAIAIDACGNWATSPSWANVAGNPNRLNLQKACQFLMTRDGAPAALYVPGEASADNYNFTVFGPAANAFPFDLAVQGGNPNLKSERADTLTIGGVFRSPLENPALHRLTLSVDWYKIDLKGAIDIPDQITVYQQCLDGQYNSLIASTDPGVTGAQIVANNPYCALIQREFTAQFPYAADRRYRAQYVNQGGIKTRGIDVQVDWGTELNALGLESVPGGVNFNVQYNHLNRFSRAPFPGGEFVDEGGTWAGGNYNFRNRWLTTAAYNLAAFSVGLRWQHLPGLNPPAGLETSVPLKSHNQLDLYSRYQVKGGLELRAGIDNLLNADPEAFGATLLTNPDGSRNDADSNNAMGSSSIVHDTFGRRFYLGARMHF